MNNNKVDEKKFFFKLHFDTHKLSIQIQISLIVGSLYLAGLHTDVCIEQKKKTNKV